MSSQPPPTEPIDQNTRAAEFALGLLEGSDLSAAQRLAATDPAFAAEVARWSMQLSPLFDEVEPIAPPTSTFAMIERRLAPDPSVDLKRRVRAWQWISGGMTAIAASLAAVLLLPASRVSPWATEPFVVARAPMVAVLEGGKNHLVASWNGADQVVIVPAGLVAAPTGKAHELWMIPKDGKPRSMGVISSSPRKMAVTPTIASLLADGAAFAVSVEPSGGSPTGQPTGPVIASGKLVAT